MKKIEIDGAKLSLQEFDAYVKEQSSWFESASDLLLDIEKDGDMDTRMFYDVYKTLLERRLECCIVSSEHYREMAKVGFWFMKKRWIKLAKQCEAVHKLTLQELINVKIYMKLTEGSVGGYND